MKWGISPPFPVIIGLLNDVQSFRLGFCILPGDQVRFILRQRADL